MVHLPITHAATQARYALCRCGRRPWQAPQLLDKVSGRARQHQTAPDSARQREVVRAATDSANFRH